MHHHEAALARFAETAATDRSALAVILQGSLARGTGEADADVDVALVVTDDRWDQAFRVGQLAYLERTDADGQGIEIDVRVVCPAYLDDAALRGDDPVRAGFANARVVWSRIAGLDGVLERIGSVTEAQWVERQASHIALARVQGHRFLRQAARQDDAILLAHAAIHLAVATMRALLALNREWFAGAASLRASVARLDIKPSGIDEELVELVRAPSIECGLRVLDLLESVADWPLGPEATWSRYVLDNELAWRERVPPPEFA